MLGGGRHRAAARRAVLELRALTHPVSVRERARRSPREDAVGRRGRAREVTRDDADAPFSRRRRRLLSRAVRAPRRRRRLATRVRACRDGARGDTEAGLTDLAVLGTRGACPGMAPTAGRACVGCLFPFVALGL